MLLSGPSGRRSLAQIRLLVSPMVFGDRVIVMRGSPGRRNGTPGCLRPVKGILVGSNGCERQVKLLQDDPFATVGYCTKSGDIGWWSASVVEKDNV